MVVARSKQRSTQFYVIESYTKRRDNLQEEQVDEEEIEDYLTYN